MQILLRISRVIDAVTNWLGGLSVYLVIITVVIGFYNVLVRYIGRFVGLQLSSNVYIELQWYLYSLVFFLGFAYILQHGINVRVDFIYTHWPKKRKAALDFFGHILFLLPFCLIGIWVSVSPVLSSWGRKPNGSWCFEGDGPVSLGSLLVYFLDVLDLTGNYCGESSPDPSGLNRAPIKAMIIVAFVLLLLQTFSELIKLYAAMTGREALIGRNILDADAPLRIE